MDVADRPVCPKCGTPLNRYYVISDNDGQFFWDFSCACDVENEEVDKTYYMN